MKLKLESKNHALLAEWCQYAANSFSSYGDVAQLIQRWLRHAEEEDDGPRRAAFLEVSMWLKLEADVAFMEGQRRHRDGMPCPLSLGTGGTIEKLVQEMRISGWHAARMEVEDNAADFFSKGSTAYRLDDYVNERLSEIESVHPDARDRLLRGLDERTSDAEERKMFEIDLGPEHNLMVATTVQCCQTITDVSPAPKQYKLPF